MVSVFICGRTKNHLLTIVGPRLDTLADWSFNVSNVCPLSKKVNSNQIYSWMLGVHVPLLGVFQRERMDTYSVVSVPFIVTNSSLIAVVSGSGVWAVRL